MPQATPAMNDVIASPFGFPAVRRKKVTAAFDGGRLTSDGGVLLLAQAERELRICAQLAGCIGDLRDPSRVIHSLDDILRGRSWRSTATTKMPTTLMLCAMIQASARRWASCRAPALALPVSRW